MSIAKLAVKKGQRFCFQGAWASDIKWSSPITTDKYVLEYTTVAGDDGKAAFVLERQTLRSGHICFRAAPYETGHDAVNNCINPDADWEPAFMQPPTALTGRERLEVVAQLLMGIESDHFREWIAGSQDNRDGKVVAASIALRQALQEVM